MEEFKELEPHGPDEAFAPVTMGRIDVNVPPRTGTPLPLVTSAERHQHERRAQPYDRARASHLGRHDDPGSPLAARVTAHFPRVGDRPFAAAPDGQRLRRGAGIAKGLPWRAA